LLLVGLAIVSRLHFLPLLVELLRESSVTTAVSDLELVLRLDVSLLRLLVWGIELHQITSEDAVEALTKQIIFSEVSQLSKRWREFFLKHEVSLSHLVLKATHVAWLRYFSDFYLLLAFSRNCCVANALSFRQLLCELRVVTDVLRNAVELLIELLLSNARILSFTVCFRNKLNVLE